MRGGYCGTRPFGVPGLLLRAVPLVFWAPSGPDAREITTREPDGSEVSISKLGQAPPPPTGAFRSLRRPPQQTAVAHRWGRQLS